eukprot:2024248-Alexandrium_andersonii.AAC.1
MAVGEPILLSGRPPPMGRGGTSFAPRETPEVQSETIGNDEGDPPFVVLFDVAGASKGIHGTVRDSQCMDLSDLWMSAPSQLFRATRETCSQFGVPRML